MNSNHTRRTLREVLRPARWGLAGAALAALLAGCNLLKVDAPSRIPADQLASPNNASLLVQGAVADFECAYGAYVGLTAELSHEMVDATETAARWVYDKRDVHSNDALYGTSGCEALGVYTPLSTARWSADNILTKLQAWSDAEVPDRQKLIATAAAYAGYDYLLLGEGFCSAAIDLSAPLTSQELFAQAEDRFTTAIQAAQSSGSTDILNLAYVGRARARLDQGDLQGAGANAALVPAGFEFDATASASASRRSNRVYAQNGQNPTTGGEAMSVDSAYIDVMFDGVADPRVPVVDAHFSTTNGTPMFYQLKYNSLSDPIPVATYTEAQLILAEAEGGQQAVNIINQLHDAVGLPHFQSTNPDSIEAQILWERRSALWLQGERFYDIRRMNLPLVPAPGAPYKNGGVYGDTRCLPLPDVETNNNPNAG